MSAIPSNVVDTLRTAEMPILLPRQQRMLQILDASIFAVEDLMEEIFRMSKQTFNDWKSGKVDKSREPSSKASTSFEPIDN
jgi:hypothetical protein